MALEELVKRYCKPCPPGTPPLGRDRVEELIRDLPGWESTGRELAKTFEFDDYYETIAFVNAIAWVAHGEDHHPDLEVGYNRCRVRYSTHSVGGLSENDFICAAKVETLLA